MIVSIPDLCLLFYFGSDSSNGILILILCKLDQQSYSCKLFSVIFIILILMNKISTFIMKISIYEKTTLFSFLHITKHTCNL